MRLPALLGLVDIVPRLGCRVVGMLDGLDHGKGPLFLGILVPLVIPSVLFRYLCLLWLIPLLSDLLRLE